MWYLASREAFIMITLAPNSSDLGLDHIYYVFYYSNSVTWPTLFQVMPSYQPLHGDEYKGIVFARFWRFGKWETIYFDDMLPTMYGRPLFAKSSDPDEFWISLLEKGYAK